MKTVDKVIEIFCIAMIFAENIPLKFKNIN